MNKKDLLTAKSLMAAGIVGVFVLLGAGNALAAEDSTAAQTAAGAAVDAAGAEKIALADAGATADAAERLYTEADREDGEAVYEVSFYVDQVEYDYLIREADGAILEWELDGRDVGAAAVEQSLEPASAAETETPAADGAAESETTAPGGDSSSGTQSASGTDVRIGIERAKEIALADVNLAADDVTFNKLKYENDNRLETYELEFSQGRQEYEYTVDAYTGEILKMERD